MNLNNSKNTGNNTNSINEKDEDWFQIPFKKRLKIIGNKQHKDNQISQEEKIKIKKRNQKKKNRKSLSKENKIYLWKEDFDNDEDNITTMMIIIKNT